MIFTANTEIVHLYTLSKIDRQWKLLKPETWLLCQNSAPQIQLDAIKSGELPVNP